MGLFNFSLSLYTAASFTCVDSACFADLTPCISPLPHDAPVLDKPVTSEIKEDAEVTGVRKLFGETGRVALWVFWAENDFFGFGSYSSGCHRDLKLLLWPCSMLFLF